MAVIKVPNSLGAFKQTQAPIYLSLRYAPSSVLGKWRGISDLSEAGEPTTYILPPPKQGLGQATHSTSLDEVSMWNNTMTGRDMLRAVLGDTNTYALGKASSYFEDNYDYVVGGAKMPRDLSAMTFKGVKKRTYNFAFQLFSYNSDDAAVIQAFIETMHLACLPEARIEEDGTKSFYTPGLFQPGIVSGVGGQEGDTVGGWLIDPKPCTMLAFNSSGGQFATVASSSGNPGIITVNMLMAEVEPVVQFGTAVKIASKAFEEEG